MNANPHALTEIHSPFGLIAGNGRFPIEFAENARARGIKVITVAIRGEADRRIEDLSEQTTWIGVGQLGKLVRTLKRAGVRQAAFAGGVTRVNFVDGFRIDWRGLRMLSRMRSFNDDSMLRNVIAEIESAGIQVISASVLLEKSVPTAGYLTTRRLTENEIREARIGWDAARAIGNLDIGQSVIVRNKTVIAVEAVEGTDKTIERAGLVRGADGVLVKLAKPIQDLRVDLPAIGVRTIELMAESRLTALVIEAERALLLEPQAIIERANALKIAIIAVTSADDLTVRP